MWKERGKANYQPWRVGPNIPHLTDLCAVWRGGSGKGQDLSKPKQIKSRWPTAERNTEKHRVETTPMKMP